jgi:hypothetical protein
MRAAHEKTVRYSPKPEAAILATLEATAGKYAADAIRKAAEGSLPRTTRASLWKRMAQLAGDCGCLPFDGHCVRALADHPTRPLTSVSALVTSFSRVCGTENGSSVSTTRSARFPTSSDPRSFSIPHP